jgi:hypothetical protein
MATCGRPRKKDGKPCQNPVKLQGLPCYLPEHRGLGALMSGTSPAQRLPVTPPPAFRQAARPKTPPAAHTKRQTDPPPPSPRERDRERVGDTARFCADTLSSGWQEAVADRAAEYAQTSWERLSRSRRKRSCKALARIARLILQAKAQAHRAVGKVSGWIVGAFGANDAAREFTEELVSNIPLPIDDKMIAVARGVQVAGVLLCLMDGRDLTECECFVDLALAETKERVKQVLVAAMSDWVNLARFRPHAAPAG